MEKYSNRYFISTSAGLHFIEVNKDPTEKLVYKLLNSDNGDDAHNQFALSDQIVACALEIQPGYVLAATYYNDNNEKNKYRLIVIEASSR